MKNKLVLAKLGKLTIEVGAIVTAKLKRLTMFNNYMFQEGYCVVSGHAVVLASPIESSGPVGNHYTGTLGAW